jgi:hypothetical protein
MVLARDWNLLRKNPMRCGKSGFEPLPRGLDFGGVGAGVEEKDLLSRGDMRNGFKTTAEFAAHGRLLL